MFHKKNKERGPISIEHSGGGGNVKLLRGTAPGGKGERPGGLPGGRRGRGQKTQGGQREHSLRDGYWFKNRLLTMGKNTLWGGLQ